MEDLARAIEDQRVVHNHLTRLTRKFDGKTNEEKTRGLVQGFLEEIEVTYKQFKDNHEQIYDYVRDKSIPFDDVPYLKEEVYYDFYDLYLAVKGKLLDALSEFRNPQSPSLHSSTFTAPPSHRNESFCAEVRLPKINIPDFTGGYLNWISYRDLFISLVHNNGQLSKIQKYYYLLNSCKEIPFSIVNEFPPAETSYEPAWSALNDRYDNKRKIVEHILQKLLDIPKSNGSFESVQRILDNTKNCLSLLRTMNINCDSWDAILIHLTVGKLDIQTYKEWEQSLKATKEIPPIKELFVFLETTFRTLESIGEHHQPRQDIPNRSSKLYRRPQSPRVHVTAISDENCPCCEKRHLLYKCFKFASLSSAAKRNLIFSKQLCKNCLHSGHFSDNCRLQTCCHICKQRHHTIIHNEFNSPQIDNNTTTDQEPSSASPQPNSEDNCNLSILHITARPQVLLATARVIIATENGNITLRALLDQGAQATLITENAVQTLQLPKNRTFARIFGLGGKAITTRKYVNFSIKSAFNKDFNLESSAYVLPSLTDYCPSPVNRNLIPNLSNFVLADPAFDSSEKIDLLIGGDIYGDVMEPQQQKFNEGIFIQLSQFGWVVSGPTAKISYNNDVDVNVNLISLDNQLRAFWEQEELIEQRQLTLEEKACEEHFKNNHSRTTDGRYLVKMPFIAELVGGAPPKFEYTDYNALKRLKHMEQRFVRDIKLASEYQKFMTEYEKLGHMAKVGVYPQNLHPQGYFLPHHGVLRESSSTTKLRVVFDGSSKRLPNTSLNEELSPGPALQNDLPAIITRWRRFKIGFRSDIEKMFRQIKVVEDQHHYQQILWRNTTDSDIFVFKLQTVTYGTSCAPYLSIRVLHQLAEDEKESFPHACNVLRTDTYVDDVISGADTVEDAIHLQKQLVALLQSGGFNLRKWISNSSELMCEIPDSYKEKIDKVEFDDQNVVKALGLQWETITDMFSFKVNFEIHEKLTKSCLLSDAAKLYDHLGWLSPVTINAKITFQKLWLIGIDWKDIVPTNIKIDWDQYITQLKDLEKIRIPRWIGSYQTNQLELHGFCDSSQSAYAAAVYIKVLECGSGSSRVHLIQSKTKVSPLKKLTIPKLELCGATLLAKLMAKIQTHIYSEITNIYYWTDSMTVLSWIRGESSKWTVFVGNRVAEIQRLSNNSQWRHISSQDNPADCASRGISVQELLDHELWWTGPKWLSNNNTYWPKQPDEPYHTSSELRKSSIVANSVKTVHYPELLTTFSSLNKLIRVTVYVLRFGTKKEKRESGFIKTHEINRARRTLIKLSQQIEYEDEIKQLQQKKSISSNSNILRLCPFLDEFGILRVGGRIHKAKFNYDLKHPILLSKHNPLSLLIFSDAHAKTLHGGLTQMQAYVSRTFWVLSARNLAKGVQRRCVTCFKYKAKAAQQIMGDLPAVRVQPSRPFRHSGVDYAGPITIKQSTARHSVTTKGYICLFICMVTKAIHLEGVTSLTSEAFVAAFRRFTARRGMCTELYSDCGTNFIGANKELQILNRRSRASLPEELVEQLANTGTQWHFIPPASPHFGGLWEAGVKSTKHHLRRMMKNRVLTYEELCTLLTQIECCLNSRPLCPLSSDPADFQALTPSHFLVGEPTLCIPDENLLERNVDRLTRWKVVECLKQQFWKRWACEYLNRLQSRPKWLKPHKNADVGDLVLIVDERVPPGQWPLARITEIHPGTDGHVRVVSTEETQYIRTVDNLIASRLSLKVQLQAIHFAAAGAPPVGVNSNSHMMNALSGAAIGSGVTSYGATYGGGGSSASGGALLLRCTAQIGDLYQEYKEIELGTPQRDPVPARVTSSVGGLRGFFESYFGHSSAAASSLNINTSYKSLLISSILILFITIYQRR